MDNLYTELKGSIDGRPQVVIGRNDSNLMRVRVYVEEDVGGEHRIDQLLFAPANDELGGDRAALLGAVSSHKELVTGSKWALTGKLAPR